jgi:hypothetical protein
MGGDNASESTVLTSLPENFTVGFLAQRITRNTPERNARNIFWHALGDQVCRCCCKKKIRSKNTLRYWHWVNTSIYVEVMTDRAEFSHASDRRFRATRGTTRKNVKQIMGVIWTGSRPDFYAVHCHDNGNMDSRVSIIETDQLFAIDHNFRVECFSKMFWDILGHVCSFVPSGLMSAVETCQSTYAPMLAS